MLSPLLSWLTNNGISARLVRACTVFPLISILCCSAVVSFRFIAILGSLERAFAFWVGRPICRKTRTEIEHKYTSPMRSRRRLLLPTLRHRHRIYPDFLQTSVPCAVLPCGPFLHLHLLGYTNQTLSCRCLAVDDGSCMRRMVDTCIPGRCSAAACCVSQLVKHDRPLSSGGHCLILPLSADAA